MVRLSEVEPNICYYVFMQYWQDTGWGITSGNGGTEDVTFRAGDFSKFLLCTSEEEARAQFTNLFNKGRSYIVPVMLLDSGEWV